MRVIMVPVANRPETKTALASAFELAERVGADVVGCHLRPHRDKDKAYKARRRPLFGSSDKTGLDLLERKTTAGATRDAEKAFIQSAGVAGFAVAKQPRRGANGVAIWRELVGSPDKLMSIMGPLSDLTVVSRPAAGGAVGRMFMLSALIQGGRPVLIQPAQARQAPGKRIAIAWNQSVEAARVVAACMPLLATAEQVTILSSGSGFHVGPKAAQLKTYLRHWNVKAELQSSKGRDEGRELRQMYRESNSDLLLMGAYSRSRLREIVFGGFTEKMLWDTDIPVIMQHA